eukprot:2802548-Pyramimonas_sp.AAC.1
MRNQSLGHRLVGLRAERAAYLSIYAPQQYNMEWIAAMANYIQALGIDGHAIFFLGGLNWRGSFQVQFGPGFQVASQ